MKTLSIILTLNTAIVIFSTLYISSKLNRNKKHIERATDKICEEVNLKTNIVLNEINIINNKARGLDDNCIDGLSTIKESLAIKDKSINDSLFDIKVDLESKDKNMLHSKEELIEIFKKEFNDYFIKTICTPLKISIGEAGSKNDMARIKKVQ